jgi:hypothetical protein
MDFFLAQPNLTDLVNGHIDASVPVLQIGRDRMSVYPGAAFHGVAFNTGRWWEVDFSRTPSGSRWFDIYLDAVGIFWEVDYVIWGKGCAFVSTPEHRFYWAHGKSGLASKVLRPLYLDWMLRGALASEFGPDYLRELLGDPVLLAEYDSHLVSMEGLLTKFQVERRPSQHYSGKSSPLIEPKHSRFGLPVPISS